MIFVTAAGAALRDAPFGKAGQVAFDGRHLADEGDGDYAAWFKVTGAAETRAPPMAASGVLEGTLNLVEIFGDDMPESILIGAARYGSADGGALQAQVPASTDSNGDVDAGELHTFALVDPTPPPPPPPADSDEDGVPDAEDNCPAVANSDQGDFDSDGIGDLCDMCPATSPGSTVDGYGCETDGGTAHPNPNPNDDPGQAEGCSCGVGASASGQALLPLFVLVLLLRPTARADKRAKKTGGS
jgi:hypothetical protein